MQVESEEIELIPAATEMKNGKAIEMPIEVDEEQHVSNS